MTAKNSGGRILTTTAEMKRAAREAREREKTATKIRVARYDPVSDAVITELSTGVTLSVPRHLIPGFARATAASLADLEINPGSESLWSDTVDDGVLLEQLIELAAGDELLQVLGGRISGRRRSPAKAQASRLNGAKGGRPPFSMASFLRYFDEKLHTLVPNAPHGDTSGDPNPKIPTGGTWRAGDLRLTLKFHGYNEIQVASTWPRRRVTERRIRSTADRLAREFAARLTADEALSAEVRVTDVRSASHRKRSQAARFQRKRAPSAPR